MKYMGEYTLKVENGQVVFPWGSLVGTNRVWVASEFIIDEEKVIRYAIIEADKLEEYISENEQYADKFKILSSGVFLLDADNLWKVPEIILKHLKTNDIIFCGVDTFVEIMSVEDMDNYNVLVDELEEALGKAVIEEGLSDENTK